jgi:hypothetical protein
MSDKTPSRKLPGDAPDHHTLSATRLRVLAADATTGPLKARLLEEAERLERIAANDYRAFLSVPSASLSGQSARRDRST